MNHGRYQRGTGRQGRPKRSAEFIPQARGLLIDAERKDHGRSGTKSAPRGHWKNRRGMKSPLPIVVPVPPSWKEESAANPHAPTLLRNSSPVEEASFGH